MLRDDINNAVKDAMRAKEERKLSTLRMVNSTIKNADIAARGEGKPPLSDADLLGVFQKMIKQRQESVELYDKGGRAELAAQEREEIAIISAYLPKQMSEDDVKAAISAAVTETGAAGMKDMGKVIAVLEGEIRRADGFRQSQRLGEGGADGVSHRRPGEPGPISRGRSCFCTLVVVFLFQQHPPRRMGPGVRRDDERKLRRPRMLTEAATYDELYRNFRWDIPARFNMATACCDRYADGTKRLALIYVDEDGATSRTSFDEVADMSRRFANVLKADGLVRGDRVAVFLSQSLELPIAHLAAFRSGMISIPLFALFGEDALEFRLSNSEAKAVITDAAGWEKLAKIRDRLPALKNIYVIGDRCAGRHQIVLGVAEGGVTGFYDRRHLGRRSRADHLHFRHHGKSKRRAACASRRARPSAQCRDVPRLHPET